MLLLGRELERDATTLLPPVANPEVQSLVPSRVVRIVHMELVDIALTQKAQYTGVALKQLAP